MSFGFKGYFTKITIDRAKFTKEMERRGMQVLRGAAREWALAVYVRVPVWTGMARGALKYAKGRSGPSAGLFLSEYLKVSIPIGPNRDSLVGMGKHDGKALAIRPDKSPRIGGTKARYTFSYYRGRFNFTFNVGVAHYEVNEFTEGPPPSYTRPWHSFDEGNHAFRDYIKTHALNIIPKLKDVTVTSHVDFGSK